MAETSVQRPSSASSVFDLSEVPENGRARWYLLRDGVVDQTRGFSSKGAADAWIKDFGHRLDWRVGFVFRLRGDTAEMTIVDRDGKKALP
jgi:hypothetical protein